MAQLTSGIAGPGRRALSSQTQALPTLATLSPAPAHAPQLPSSVTWGFGYPFCSWEESSSFSGAMGPRWRRLRILPHPSTETKKSPHLGWRNP